MTNKNILILDDDEEILKTLESYFEEKSQHFVSSTVDPLYALELIKDNQFDAIIFDINMRRLNGLEFLEKAKKIQTDPLYICMSGYMDLFEIQLKRKEVFHIEKPFNVGKLVAFVIEKLEDKKS